MVITLDQEKFKLISPQEFHSRKTYDLIERWRYGRISEKQLVDSLVLIGYDKEIVSDILEDDG
jgi:hypothetical protein